MIERLKAVARRCGLGPVPTPVLAIGIAACVAIAASGFMRWGRTPGPAEAVGTEDPFASFVETRTIAPAVEATVTAPAVMVFVHVVGAVMRPGVYEVESGSRLAAVIGLAGGFTGDAEEVAVNLARQVSDGEQVFVPTQDEWAASPAASTPAPSPGQAQASAPRASSAPGNQSTPALVNVNSADAATLETLPGIGPVIAQRIIQDREQNGPFASVDDLVRVSGIGEKTLESLRPYVTVR